MKSKKQKEKTARIYPLEVDTVFGDCDNETFGMYVRDMANFGCDINEQTAIAWTLGRGLGSEDND